MFKKELTVDIEDVPVEYRAAHDALRMLIEHVREHSVPSEAPGLSLEEMTKLSSFDQKSLEKGLAIIAQYGTENRIDFHVVIWDWNYDREADLYLPGNAGTAYFTAEHFIKLGEDAFLHRKAQIKDLRHKNRTFWVSIGALVIAVLSLAFSVLRA